MKSWFKKILQRCCWKQIRDIIIGAIAIITVIPGTLLCLIGMLADDSRFKDYGMICMATLCATLTIYCMSIKNQKGTIACSMLLIYFLYILVLY